LVSDWSSDVCSSDLARHVHMLVRGEGLSDSMSRYLIRRIEESPAITLRKHTQVVALEGAGRLERIAWRGAQAPAPERRDIRHLRSEERRVGKERRRR